MQCRHTPESSSARSLHSRETCALGTEGIGARLQLLTHQRHNIMTPSACHCNISDWTPLGETAGGWAAISECTAPSATIALTSASDFAREIRLQNKISKRGAHTEANIFEPVSEVSFVSEHLLGTSSLPVLQLHLFAAFWAAEPDVFVKLM